MKVQALHPSFKMPTRSSELAGGYDIYMPNGGNIEGPSTFSYGLGFATEIPVGYVALLLPRSSAAKSGLELANTIGLIDADYRGEWMVKLRSKTGARITWSVGERIVQFALVPVLTPLLELVESVAKTERGAGGFGSTGA